MDLLQWRQRRRIKAAFRSFCGADLLIDPAEWKRALGIGDDRLARRIFDLVDSDASGFIDFDEFLAFAEGLYAEDRRQRLELIFRIYDTAGDGALDRREVREILEASLADQRVTLSDAVMRALVRSFMRRVDANRNGRVSLAEFIAVVGAYPGIDEQFAAYAADLLNHGQSLKSPPVKAARLGLRLRRAWERRRRALFWGVLYTGANGALFAGALAQYAEAGAAIALARAAGACLYLNVALILLPLCKCLWTCVRRSRFERLFPLDRLVDVHRALGYAIVAFTLLHVGAHLYNYYASATPLLPQLLYTTVGATGMVAVASLALMLRLSASVRRRRYERFVWSHLFYAVFLVALLYHARALWAWLALPLAVYALDGVVRLLYKTRAIDIVEVKPLANGVTRVHFKKPRKFEFYPGDYVRLQIRRLSRLQWHPFTISAAPEAAVIGVHVRNNGDWTGALHNLSRRQPAEGVWRARIDGPYGAPLSRVTRAKVAVLIAAGIGVTPFASTLQSLLLRHRRGRGARNEPDQHVYFHWLNRSQQSYEWFTALLTEAEQTLGRERFRLHIHLTSLTYDLTNIAMQIAMDAYREHHERDPITGLAAATSAGRPEWDLIFNGVSAAHPGERIEVFFCGPRQLGDEVKKKCRKHGLVYHEEKF